MKAQFKIEYEACANKTHDTWRLYRRWWFYWEYVTSSSDREAVMDTMNRIVRNTTRYYSKHAVQL